MLVSIGLGALFSAVSASQYHTFSPADRASFNPISTSLNGMLFAHLAIGVLGVLLISGEYSTGMIRSSLTAVPRRLPVLWAKLGVFAGAVLSRPADSRSRRAAATRCWSAFWAGRRSGLARVPGTYVPASPMVPTATSQMASGTFTWHANHLVRVTSLTSPL